MHILSRVLLLQCCFSFLERKVSERTDTRECVHTGNILSNFVTRVSRDWRLDSRQGFLNATHDLLTNRRKCGQNEIGY